MNNNILARLSIIWIILLPLLSFGQDPVKTSQNHNEQVTIISSFDPSINQAYKINTSPEDLIFSIDKPEFTFQSLDINQPTEITLNPIKPAIINADKRTRNN